MPSRWILVLGALLLAAPSPAAAFPRPKVASPDPTVLARGATCKTVGSCREAVELWCGGYSRADGDHDGIPCENVCHSREQVREIQSEIGCQ